MSDIPILGPDVRISKLCTANVIRSSNLAVPTGALTAIPWESVTRDTHQFWNPGTPTRINIPFSGGYLFGIEGTFAAVAGNRTQQIVVLHNGTHRVVDMSYSALAGLSTSVAGSSLHFLKTGDYLECSVLQDSGGDLNFLAASPDLPQFWIFLLGY